MTGDDAARQVELLREELRAAFDSGQLASAGIESRSISRAEILRGLLAAIGKHGGGSSLVSLSRNAKGETQIEVAVRTGDTPGVETAADAMAEAVRLYDSLREVYPMTNGPTRD